MLTKTKPLKNTLKLIKKYGAKLVNGTIKDNELKTLAKQKNFTVTGCNKQEAMIDFVITIAPFLTKQQLHHTTSKLITADLKHAQKNTFWRNNHLSKYFAAYEVIKSLKSQKISVLPDELTNHFFNHKSELKTRMSNCYNDLSSILTTMIFPNAVKLVAARLQGDYKFKITPSFNNKKQTSKYDNIIDIQITSPQLEKCLKKQIKLNYPEKNPNQKPHPLAETNAFKKLKKSIKTIRDRSTYKDLLKAHGIQQIVNAIETNKSNKKILQIIAGNKQNIIKNTGTGFYAFFNCGCCGGYQSKSHKLLDKIKNILENPEPPTEKTPLI
ncbi:MAG: hypothetical protein PVI75_00190 [Gammaproteobacteria bacterium]|jgi:hypothetical protein